jgi:hypothetical protein
MTTKVAAMFYDLPRRVRFCEWLRNKQIENNNVFMPPAVIDGFA